MLIGSNPNNARFAMLKQCLLLAALIGLGGAPALLLTPQAAMAAPAASVWKFFSSESGGFKVLMPGEPKSGQSQNVQFVTVDRPKEAVVYTVSYVDFPVSPKDQPGGVKEAFSGVKAGIVEANAEVTAEQDVELKGYPGQEMRVVQASGLVTRFRSYVVDKRMYIVMAQTKNEKNLAKSIEGFLNSFQLLAK
jgi:hypothetical protein